MSIFKKILSAFGILVLLGIVILGVIWYYLFAAPRNMVINEPRFAPYGAAVVQMDPGLSVPEFATRLEKQGVVKSAKVFLSLIQKLHLEKKVKQGTYVFTTSTNVFEVVNRVSSANYGYTPVKVTIPEGYTTYAIAKAIPEKLVDIKPEDFIAASAGLEGYLFPDTYFLYPYATSSALIALMRNNFDNKMKPLQESIAASGHTLEQIITMASILEKEVQTLEDKQIVSDLFWRRINTGMPLQADSTLTYVTGKTSDELTLKDLRENSPYNSYTNKGLPPGPISNPGIISIRAAISPVSNEYVFFLSDNDGVTHFSKTYVEHLRLKKKYLP